MRQQWLTLLSPCLFFLFGAVLFCLLSSCIRAVPLCLLLLSPLCWKSAFPASLESLKHEALKAFQCASTVKAVIENTGNAVGDGLLPCFALKMLLRGAGVTADGGICGSLGRSDLVALFAGCAVVLEFKFAPDAGALPRLQAEGLKQIADRGYARPFDDVGRAVTAAVVVVDAAMRQAVCCAAQDQED